MFAVLTLALKDLLLLTRNYASLFWIFVFPLLLALFFGVTFGGFGGEKVRSISVAFVDQDKTEASKKLRERLQDAQALDLRDLSEEQARASVRKGGLAAFVIVPKGFGSPGAMFQPSAPSIKLGVDPGRQATGGFLQGKLMQAYYAGMQDQFGDAKVIKKQVPIWLKNIEKTKNLPPALGNALKDFLPQLQKFANNAGAGNMQKGGPFQQARIEIEDIARPDNRPKNSFEITFPSSILWGILGCVQAFVISIVIERTEGTFLRLRIAPLSWSQVLAGKALACFLAVVGMAVVLLVLSRIVFGVRLHQPLHLFMAVFSSAICFVGLMMLLSTIGKTVNGVAGAAWGIMLPMAMIGGGMIPLFIMPDWMLQISHLSPVKWGIWSLEGAIWRDFSFSEMLLPCGILVGIGLVSFLIGVKKLSWGEG